MNKLARHLPLVLSALLSACATIPLPTLHRLHFAAPTAHVADIAAPVTATLPHAATTDVWQRLRNSFAMADCAADPEVLTWARRYTSQPHRFEAQLGAVLPRLAYIQQIAAEHGVPGEFALLPWVESGFRPLPDDTAGAAGMWQITPATARSMGLAMDAGYDGRFELPATADAVMAMLRRYHDEFGDWRLTDYAYSTGEFAVHDLIQHHGTPPVDPAIPNLPATQARDHLAKLLAIACVVREPARFNVQLPQLPQDQQLVVVQLDHAMSLAAAAARAGVPAATVIDLNAAYRHGVVDVRHGGRLLLPQGPAERLRNSQLAQAAEDPGDRVASVSVPPSLPALGGDATATVQSRVEHIPATPVLPATKHPHTVTRLHRVRAGESLWQIAHRYRVSVAELERWNGLRHGHIKPGQTLKVSAPH